MATIGNLPNNQFIGSPVTIPVTAGSPANATFHRVRLKVKIPAGSNNPTVMEFSTPVESNQTVLFDIASAFRAFADSYQYTAEVPVTYPTFSADLTAYDDYLVDGDEHTGAGASSTTISGLYAGALTDWERLTSIRPSRYSCKPTSSPEICFIGHQYLIPVALTNGTTPQAPAVNSITVAAGATVPAGSQAGSKGIYGIPTPRDGYEIRFINSLGVHENVFVTGLPSREVKITTEQYVISRQETIADFSRGLAIKSGGHETLQMSTGPLDAQWQSWYVHEFLMARWVWVGIPTGNALVWVPAHILPEETVQLQNRQKTDPLAVPFALQLDIEGAPHV